MVLKQVSFKQEVMQAQVIDFEDDNVSNNPNNVAAARATVDNDSGWGSPIHSSEIAAYSSPTTSKLQPPQGDQTILCDGDNIICPIGQPALLQSSSDSLTPSRRCHSFLIGDEIQSM